MWKAFLAIVLGNVLAARAYFWFANEWDNDPSLVMAAMAAFVGFCGLMYLMGDWWNDAHTRQKCCFGLMLMSIGFSMAPFTSLLFIVAVVAFVGLSSYLFAVSYWRESGGYNGKDSKWFPFLACVGMQGISITWTQMLQSGADEDFLPVITYTTVMLIFTFVLVLFSTRRNRMYAAQVRAQKRAIAERNTQQTM